MLRRLRIAASVFFAVVAVALCVLWVRSYLWFDILPYKRLSSAKGNIYANQLLDCPEGIRNEWVYTSGYWTMKFDGQSVVPTGPPGIWMPYWLLVAFALLMAGTPWIRYRFSLRTMLLATTLVAVLLGLVVWAVR